MIKNKNPSIIIVGPYGDINTRGLDTTDGIHFTEESNNTIGNAIEKFYV